MVLEKSNSFMGCIAVFLVTVTFAKCEIPEYISVCPHDHQNLSACITNSIEKLRPLLKVGIPEIDVPALEPLSIGPIIIDSLGETSHIATNLSNVQIWGSSNFTILKLSPKLTKTGHNFRFEVIIPRLHVEGEYEIDSKILFLELQGKGPFNANLTEYHFECNLKGNKVERNGANHLLFDELKCNTVVGKVNIYLGNLFNGNAVLGKATNDVINDNSDALFQEIRPRVLGAIRKVVMDIANKITLAFKYEELFP